LRRPTAKLVLASSSPRRRELLAALGAAFVIRPADVDETPTPGEAPIGLVERLARAKAEAVGVEAGETHVLAADTIVVLDGAILGKPLDAPDARRMLAAIAGREHLVYTGVALRRIADERVVFGIAETRVRISALGPAEIDAYVSSGEPLDKAGAYGIQGLGAVFVEAIRGNYTNVVGLPVPTATRLLRELGVDWPDFRADLHVGVAHAPDSSGES
jgi:septum formation protein